jgi:hypothetical protein
MASNFMALFIKDIDKYQSNIKLFSTAAIEAHLSIEVNDGLIG